MNLTLKSVTGQTVVELSNPDGDGELSRGGGCCNPLEIGVKCLDHFMGSIYLSSYVFRPIFVIMDKDHIPLMKLKGPSQLMHFVCCAGQSLHYELTDLETRKPDGNVRGKACFPPLLGAVEPTVEVDLRQEIDSIKKVLALAAGFFIGDLYTHEHYGPIS